MLFAILDFTLEKLLGVAFLFVIPFAVAFGVFEWFKVARKRFEFPVKDKKDVLRPPGWGLRRKISDLGDELVPWVAALLGMPLLAGFAYMGSGCDYVILIGLVLITTAVSIQKILSILRQLVNYNLGLKGEEIVGYQLMSSLDGSYKVYHDLEFTNTNGKKWNIDHVVVSAGGVFVIETKCKSKIKGVPGNHKVSADEKTIKFPDSTHEKPWIAQVKRNADFLSGKLSKAIADDLSCVPIIAMPGWFVEQEDRGAASYLIMNSKFLVGHIQRQKPYLTDKQQQRVSSWLKDYCHTDIEQK